MTEGDPLRTLHTTVLCYLSTLLSIADCVADACPPVGGPYKTKLNRLKSRLAFDASAGAVEESATIVAGELKDYATRAAAYLDSHAAGQRAATAGIESLLREFSRRQEFYGARLRQTVAE